jgi:hypothetical protein
MTHIYQSQHTIQSDLLLSDQTVKANSQDPAAVGLIENDDRFPGSFFRIPGVPSPGKTAWSLVK